MALNKSQTTKEILRILEYQVEQIFTEVEKIKEWVKTKPRLINLRGGEPMMVPEIKEILKWALDNNLLDSTEVHITTNGTKLDSEWLELLQSINKLRVWNFMAFPQSGS